ncbi:CAP domain-containing protein [uncultured Hyphomonas sp.]|jgi:uncharacterized protein YkwD|uniref:CAP domain-containing protein n=1 Tax=uncultured Hyphomonas sp. TaxID=225298 RepID=UPI0030DDAA32|tara:strand:- start:36605 stop:37441 length:837 start_codon:yes stop_codon:yes gene_type:complete
MILRALFVGLAALAAGLPAFACDLALAGRGVAVADYVEQMRPCFGDLPEGYAFDARMEGEFLRLTNTARKEAGLPPLVNRAALRNSARFHSLDMAYNDFFGHVGPDGREPQDRIAAFDRRAIIQYSAENVAMIEIVRGRWNLERQAVKRLHQNLMDSPGHRANILSEQATHVSMGVVRTEAGVWVTQNFLNLSGSLAQDVPVRMRTGDRLRQMPVLNGWKFREFAAELPGGDVLPMGQGIPAGISGDIHIAAEGRKPGDKPRSYYTIHLPGPAVTVGG